MSGMFRRDLSLVCVVLTVSATTAQAAPPVVAPSIGIISATGTMLINRSSVWGNSTLFEGTSVETTEASSDLALTNGVRMQLAAQSHASVWENHAALVRGASQVTSRDGYQINARDLKVTLGSGSRARVGYTADNQLEVASVLGITNVTNSKGVLLASIPAGATMNFAFQAAGSLATRTGCLVYKTDHFLLQDDNTMEVVEVNGTGLAPNVGNHVEITGTVAATKPVVNAATLVINASSVAVKSTGGCLTVASALDASATPPTAAPAPAPATTAAAKSGGLSTGAKVGIAAAVAGGAAGAALAVSSGKKSSTSQ